MMSSGIENNDYTVIMKGSDVEQNTEEKAENETPRYTGTQPNKNPTTSIACRAIQCAGKTLLCLFTIPIMAVIEMSFEFISSVVSVYRGALIPLWEENKACALFLAVTVIPPCAVMAGGINVFAGLLFGIFDGIDIAFSLSLAPLISSWDNLKRALLGKLEPVIGDMSKNFCDHIILGESLNPKTGLELALYD